MSGPAGSPRSLRETANVERDLVMRASGGDQVAFEALVRLSAGRLFATAYRILRDHHLAEDALQQTLATIWDELPRLRDPDRFDAWSYRVIVRASVAGPPRATGRAGHPALPRRRRRRPDRRARAGRLWAGR